MGAQEICKFTHKNDILSRVEEILQWTKNEQNTWYNDLFLTTLATTVLLKTGHSKNSLNIPWIEKELKYLEDRKSYLTHVNLFSAYCLGLLSLYFTGRRKKSEVIELIRKLQTELETLGWMNTPKTATFLTLLLYEIVRPEKINVKDVTSTLDGYLTQIIQSNLSHEDLAYALFSLSLINPKRVKNFLIDNKGLVNQLITHSRIEVVALALDILDKAEIPCAEETYQRIWAFFEERRYGVVERSVVGKIVSAIYGKIAGLPYQRKEVEIKEVNDAVRLEVNITKSSLQNMIQSAPPIDQLSMVALSILWSNYDKLYLFSRRRYQEYKTLQRLEAKETHTPVQKETLSKVSSKLFRYELAKLCIKYGLFSALILIVIPYLCSVITGQLPIIPEPWRTTLGGILAEFAGALIFLLYLLKRASKKYSELTNGIEKFRSVGVWEDS
jgi:hypothetical protein